MVPLKPVTITEPDHDISISRALDALDEEPDDSRITAWFEQVLLMLDVPPKEISVRIVGREEIARLNSEYRGRPGPTNVLSFPANIEIEGRELLGDIVICSQVVSEEAARFGLNLPDRFAHMLIHGLLHLMGYDHEDETARLEMESVETRLLGQLGMPDPYVSSCIEEEAP